MAAIPALTSEGTTAHLLSVILSLDKRGLLAQRDFISDLGEVTELAKRSPFLSRSVAEELSTVYAWRDAFAHSKKMITFDRELIAKEIKEVPVPKGKRSELYERLAIVRATIRVLPVASNMTQKITTLAREPVCKIIGA
jgi:hypothetical protein